MITKEIRRKYRLHYNLRRKGNVVITREKMIYRRAKQLSDVESGWVRELLAAGYGVMDGLFSPEYY